MVFPFQPMPLSRRAAPFDHPEWVFEVKHDGFRAIAYVQAGHCQLVSRRTRAAGSEDHPVAEPNRPLFYSSDLGES